jgi:hypothetical protein
MAAVPLMYDKKDKSPMSPARSDEATNKAVTGRPYRLREAFHQSFDVISDDPDPGSPR